MEFLKRADQGRGAFRIHILGPAHPSVSSLSNHFLAHFTPLHSFIPKYASSFLRTSPEQSLVLHHSSLTHYLIHSGWPRGWCHQCLGDEWTNMCPQQSQPPFRGWRVTIEGLNHWVIQVCLEVSLMTEFPSLPLPPMTVLRFETQEK